MTTTRRLTVAVASLAAALVLGGCGEDDKDPIRAAEGAAQNVADKVQQKAYEAATVAALSAIEPGLASNPQRALDRAKKTCQAIEGKSSAEAVTQVRQRFDGGTVKVDAATAKEILRVLKKDLCPNL